MEIFRTFAALLMIVSACLEPEPASASFLKNSQSLTHEINEVTLYSGKAGITRIAPFKKRPGEQWVLIRSLPHNLMNSSLQFELINSGKAEIKQIVLMESFEKLSLPKDVEKKVQDLHSLYAKHLDLSQEKLLNREVISLLNTLKFNTPFSKSTGKMNYSPFTAKISSVHSAMNGISRESMKSVVRSDRISEDIDNIFRKIQALSSEITDVTGTRKQDWKINAYILLSSTQAQRGKIKVKYLIPNANWKPMYDVRAELNPLNGRASIRLVTSGQVQQHTGEHWKDVTLGFSTVDPAPLLNPEFPRWILEEQRIEVFEEEKSREAPSVFGKVMDAISPMAAQKKMSIQKESVRRGAKRPKQKREYRVAQGSAPDEADLEDMDEAYELNESVAAVASLESMGNARSLRGKRKRKIHAQKNANRLAKGNHLGRASGTGVGGLYFSDDKSVSSLFPTSKLATLYRNLGNVNTNFRSFENRKGEYRNLVERSQAVVVPSMIQGRPLFMKSPFKNNVKSGTRDQKIPIQTTKIDGKIKYFAVPKDQKWGYVKLQAKNPTKHNLLSGSAQIFLNGDLTSKTVIPLVGPQGTFMINLGPDRNIETKRKVDRVSSEKGLIMKDYSVDVNIEIEILNHYNFPITVELKDQFPISPHKDLKITKGSVSPESIPNKSGILSWDIRLQAREKRLIKFSYNVTHPMDFIVGGIDQ